jgi:hypothetical protein
MYLSRRNANAGRCELFTGLQKGRDMTFALQLREEESDHAALDGEAASPPEGRRVSQELCAAILNALGRDDRLRRDYVRRRWRGLVG